MVYDYIVFRQFTDASSLRTTEIFHLRKKNPSIVSSPWTYSLYKVLISMLYQEANAVLKLCNIYFFSSYSRII